MPRTDPRLARRSAALALATAVLAACIGGGDDGDETTDGSVPEIPTVTAPAERGTPFCETMIEISDRVTTDPPADITAFVIESYEAILEDVPAEIRPDFEYVLADLRGDPLPDLPEPTAPPTADAPPTTAPDATATTDVDTSDAGTAPTTDAAGAPTTGGTSPAGGSVPGSTQPVVDEFFLPNATPAERLSDYVDFTCRGRLNNPGPPATAPDVELPDPDDL